MSNGARGGSRRDTSVPTSTKTTAQKKEEREAGHQNRMAKHSKRALQDDGDEMDVDDEQEEGEDAEEEDEDITRIRDPIRMAERIALELEANPGDQESRAMAKHFIRKTFISNGGLPFNTKNPIPVDLDKLSDQELVYVLENMLIYQQRTKSKHIATQAVNTLANLAYLSSKKSGNDTAVGIIDSINSDEFLRQSIVEVLIGRTAQLNPLLSLVITGSSYITNLIVQYQHGKQLELNGNTGARLGNTTGVSQSSSSATTSVSSQSTSAGKGTATYDTAFGRDATMG